MATLRKLMVTLGVDSSELDRGLANTEKKVGSFSTSIGNAGDKMRDVGKKATIGLTLPIAAGAKVAFDAASDLAESMSKVDVVFDKSAGVIHDWSKSAATDLGMSRQQAEEAAGTFGNLFRALEIVPEQAAGLSKGMVNLASDLASFNNANPEDVLLALRSGLLGEAEPLRQFGVSLSAARIEAEALSMGLAKPVKNMAKIDAANIAVRKSVEKLAAAEAEFGKESQQAADARNKVALAEQALAKSMEGSKPELSAAAKAQAAYAIIMKDTALAQGDFARTADGAANKQRQLSAQFKDTAAQLGQQLIPIGLQLIGWVSKLFDWFSKLSPSTQKWILIGAGLLAVLGPIVGVVGALATAIGFLISPVGLVVFAIAALIAAGVLLWKNWDEVSAKLAAAWEWVKTAAGNAVDGIVDWFSKLPGRAGEFMGRLVEAVVGFVNELPGRVGTALGTFIVEWYSFWFSLPGRTWDALMTAAPLLLAAGKNLLIFLWNGMIEWAPRVIGWFADLPSVIWGFLGDAGSWLVAAGKNMVIGLWNGIVAMGDWIRSKVGEFFKGLLGPIGKALGLGSPSKITAQYGRWVVQGMQLGMLGEQSKLAATADRVARAALPSLPFVATPADPASGGASMSAAVSSAIGGGGGVVVLQVDGRELGRAALPGTREGLKKVELRNAGTGLTS